MKSTSYVLLNKRQAVFLVTGFFLLSTVLALLVQAVPRAISTAVEAASSRKPINCTDRAERVVSLTFDVTAGEDIVRQIEEILVEYKIPATFFVTGEWVERYEERARSLFEHGQELMNASDTYPHMTTLSIGNMRTQIIDCSDKIEAITGKRPTLFRAPYDEYNTKLFSVLDSLGMLAIGWDVDGLDNRAVTADALSQRVGALSSSGSIVRLHTQSEQTVLALPIILDQLLEKGFTFVAASKMIYTDKYTLNAEGRQIAVTL